MSKDDEIRVIEVLRIVSMRTGPWLGKYPSPHEIVKAIVNQKEDVINILTKSLKTS